MDMVACSWTGRADGDQLICSAPAVSCETATQNKDLFALQRNHENQLTLVLSGGGSGRRGARGPKAQFLDWKTGILKATPRPERSQSNAGILALTRAKKKKKKNPGHRWKKMSPITS